jgi:hypothetical protein
MELHDERTPATQAMEYAASGKLNTVAEGPMIIFL